MPLPVMCNTIEGKTKTLLAEIFWNPLPRIDLGPKGWKGGCRVAVSHKIDLVCVNGDNIAVDNGVEFTI